MTDSTVIAIVAMSVILITVVAFAVIISRTLQRCFEMISSNSAQHDQQQRQLLDRFQAIRWEDYAALRTIQDSDEEGGFFTPEEQRHDEPTGEVTQQNPAAWGRVTRDPLASMEETQLLEEDFPEEKPR